MLYGGRPTRSIVRALAPTFALIRSRRGEGRVTETLAYSLAMGESYHWWDWHWVKSDRERRRDPGSAEGPRHRDQLAS